jgi:hypothetical protein
MLLEQADGKWACFEFGLLVSRQNGKGAVLEARALAGLFLFELERTIIWSAHEFKTAKEAYERLKALIEQTPFLKARVEHRRTAPVVDGVCQTCLAGEECHRVSGFRQSNEDTSIKLADGCRVRFMARNKSAGRGFTGDLNIIDEAQELSQTTINASLPTLLAKTLHGNPQVIYTGTVPDPEIPPAMAAKWTKIRDIGRAGGAKRLGWLEFNPGDDIGVIDLDAHDTWARGNPALGRRISIDGIEALRDGMDDEGFAREILSIWGDGSAAAVIATAVWKSLEDIDSQPVGTVAFAIDVHKERTSSSIAVAGRRPDGLRHVELVTAQPGTDWVVETAKALDRQKPCKWLVDATGPATSLVPELTEAGLEVHLVNTVEMRQACGLFYDAAVAPSPGADVDVPVPPHGSVAPTGLRHIGQPPLNLAVSLGRKRASGDAWVWRRDDPAVDVTPLIAVTLAVLGHHLFGKKRKPKTKRARTGALVG